MSETVDIVTVGLMVSDVAVKTFSEMPARGLIAWVDYIGAHAGGDALNEAVVAARLGARVRLIGKVGCDAFGDFLVRHVADEGVDVSGIVRSKTDRTGACVALIQEDGERSFLFQPGANDTLDDTDVDVSLFAGAKCVSVAVKRNNGEELEAAVQFGDIATLALPVGETATAVIRPERGFDVGAGAGKEFESEVHGGLSGAIIDCRGRPLALPDNDNARIESLKKWTTQLDAYPA